MRFLLLFALLLPITAHAQQPVSPDQAQSVLSVLQNPQSRENLINTLQVIANAGQTKPAATAPAASPAPPTKLAPNSLGANLVVHSKTVAARFGQQMREMVQRVGDLPMLWAWIDHLASNPAARNRALTSLAKLAVVLAIGTGLDLLLLWAVKRPRLRLQARAAQDEPGDTAQPPLTNAGLPDAPHDEAVPHKQGLAHAWRLLRRLPLMLAMLALDLLPIGVFYVVTQFLLGADIGAPLPAQMIAICATAYMIFRVIYSVGRTVLLSDCRRLRLLRVSDDTAVSLRRWLDLVSGFTVFGVAAAEITPLLGLHAAARDDLIKLVMLAVHLLLVVWVILYRDKVARRLKPRRTLHGVPELLLRWLAATWHWIAIFYIIALWVVWAINVRDGVERLIHLFFITVGVLLVSRLVSIAVLGALYRALHLPPELDTRYPGVQGRLERYSPFIRIFVNMGLWFFTGLALLEAWGISVLGWFQSGGVGTQFVSAILSIGVCLLLSAFVWEAANAGIDRHLDRLTREQQIVRSARLRTLKPIVRTTLLMFILAVVALTILSEIGVNIAPLLAGAGIVGVAVGFGSQKLVQDLITGLFLLLENAVQVGDNVTVAGLSGAVEHLSIRTIRLRAGDGSVHIIPFSSVTSVTNTNRGIGNAAVNVTVDAGEDINRVSDMLKSIANDLHGDPAFASLMIGELDLWGVDSLDGGSVTLAGQIVCTDAGRWAVQREFNRRLFERSRELGIHLYHQTQTVIFRKPAARRDTGSPQEAPTHG